MTFYLRGDELPATDAICPICHRACNIITKIFHDKDLAYGIPKMVSYKVNSSACCQAELSETDYSEG